MTGADPTGADPTVGARRASSKVAADRVALPVGVLVGVIVATAASVGIAARLVPADGRDPSWAMLGGAVSGALAVGALRSVSVRSTTRWMVIIGALLLLRFGSLAIDDASGALLMLGWIAASATALVLAARSERWMWRQGTMVSGAGSRGGRSSGGGGRLVRIVVVVVCLVAAAGVGLGPAVAQGFSNGPSLGDRPSFERGSIGSAVAATERLDMRTRPRLSDAVVLSVATALPSFWRSQTFDEWDGQQWTRSVRDLTVVPESGTITPPDDDLVSAAATSITQEVTVEAPYLSALPTAPSAVSVDAPTTLLQWEDGSVATNLALGKGARYRVESRQRRDLTPDLLRSTEAAEIPADLTARYASDPVTTERVRRLALEITAGASTAYDKARAIESWLDANTRYSLDAPVAPSDADVVDDFLFVSKLGWCEQIASSFTVLLRASGVPARLAVGYVPEGRDPVTQRFLVRERDAHAWTEVWFAGVGWVPFDPTAGVTLAGDTPESFGSQLSRYGSWVLLGLALVLGLWSALVDGATALVRAIVRLGRARPSGRRSRRRGPVSWPAETELALERLGRRWGRDRGPAETTTSYARALGVHVGDDRLGAVGELVDRARFAAQPPGDEERAAVAAVLETVDASAATSSPGEPVRPTARR